MSATYHAGANKELRIFAAAQIDGAFSLTVTGNGEQKSYSMINSGDYMIIPDTAGGGEYTVSLTGTAGRRVAVEAMEFSHTLPMPQADIPSGVYIKEVMLSENGNITAANTVGTMDIYLSESGFCETDIDDVSFDFVCDNPLFSAEFDKAGTGIQNGTMESVGCAITLNDDAETRLADGVYKAQIIITFSAANGIEPMLSAKDNGGIWTITEDGKAVYTKEISIVVGRIAPDAPENITVTPQGDTVLISGTAQPNTAIAAQRESGDSIVLLGFTTSDAAGNFSMQISAEQASEVTVFAISDTYMTSNAAPIEVVSQKTEAEIIEFEMPALQPYTGLPVSPKTQPRAEGTTGYFSYYYEGINGTEYSGSTPPINAGDYRVTVKLNDSRYYGEQTAEFTISKAVPKVSFPERAYVAQGKPLSEAVFIGGEGDGTFEFADGTLIIEASEGTLSLPVVFIPSDSTNYENVTENVNVAVSGVAQQPEEQKIRAEITGMDIPATQVYTGQPVTLRTPPQAVGTGNVFTYLYKGINGTVYNSSMPPTNAGTYTLTVSLNDSRYYGEKTVQFIVTKAVPDVTFPTAAIVDAGKPLSTAVFTGGSGNGGFAFAQPERILTKEESPASVSVIFTPTDSTNFESVTNTVTVTVRTESVKPSEPSVTLIPGNRQITVRWSITDDGGSPITGFVVICDGKEYSVAANTSEYVIGNLVNNRAYTVTVRAQNSVGYAEAVATATPKSNGGGGGGTGSGSSGGSVTPPVADNPTTVNEWTNPFRDVKITDWFYEAVKFANENGLMKGVSETEFAPDESLTRAMFVTVLYRIEGEPEASSSTFTDVENGIWFDKAVAWAAANGIVNGVSETEFAPNRNITREQMAVMAYRYAKFKGYDVSVTGNTSYTDNADISDYAKTAIVWAAEKGIMSGNTDGSFAPLESSTRAQAAAVFQRIIEKLKN